MAVHVVPVGDLIEHVTVGECPCGPRPKVAKREGGSVCRLVVHHALDAEDRADLAIARSVPAEPGECVPLEEFLAELGL